MAYQIQKHVPLPKARGAGAPQKYPFREMAVGDMFFVPNLEKNTLIQYASAVGKELGRKFATRLVYMVKRKGVWVPAKADTVRAVRGVAVWRRS